VATTGIIVICTILLIINGTCSTPQGLTAKSPVCVGGSLSVQSWLAITGLELSLLTTVTLPRAKDRFLSKYFTRHLTKNGLLLSTLLNTQASAPAWIQIRASWRLFLFRGLVVVLAAGISITYKFTFVKVAAYDTVALPYDGLYYDLGANSESNTPLLSNNIQDVLSGFPRPSMYSTFNSSTQTSEFIFGGSFNIIVAQGIGSGTIFYCYPDFYSRTTLVTTEPSWTDTAPLIGQLPSNNSVRFTNPVDNSLVDITSSNGTLQAFFGYPGNATLSDVRYSVMVSASTRLCVGLMSWSKDPSTTFGVQWDLNNTQEISCRAEIFSLDFWNSSDSGMFTSSLIRAILASQTPNHTQSYPHEDYNLLNITIPLIIAGTYHLNVPLDGDFNETANPALRITTWPVCKYVNGSYGAFEARFIAQGLVFDHGTGMTLLGIILQAIVLLIAFLVLGLLLWPTLPLLTEWPAQWLSLLQDIDKDTLREALKGTSVGQHEVRGEELFFLSSTKESEETRPPRLIISRAQGEVRKGVDHI
jgi:hypothetical protein